MAPRKKQASESPNAGLKLHGIDYQNLNGDTFKEYQKIESALLMNEKYDYEMWLATSEFEYEIHRKTGKPVQYMVGITLNGNKPILNTRLTAIMARELNTHVKSGATERQNSKYYLLTKPIAATVELVEAPAE